MKISKAQMLQALAATRGETTIRALADRAAKVRQRPAAPPASTQSDAEFARATLSMLAAFDAPSAARVLADREQHRKLGISDAVLDRCRKIQPVAREATTKPATVDGRINFSDARQLRDLGISPELAAKLRALETQRGRR